MGTTTALGDEARQAASDAIADVGIKVTYNSITYTPESDGAPSVVTTTHLNTPTSPFFMAEITGKDSIKRQVHSVLIADLDISFVPKAGDSIDDGTTTHYVDFFKPTYGDSRVAVYQLFMKA